MEKEVFLWGTHHWEGTWEEWAGTIAPLWATRLVEAHRQPGSKTRKCNSGKLSEYDISGSCSICSQTLKWHIAWHGGREVISVSSLPVNRTTPSVEKRCDVEGRGYTTMKINLFIYEQCNQKKKGGAKYKQCLKGVRDRLKRKAGAVTRDGSTMGCQRMNGRKMEEGKAAWRRKWSGLQQWFFFIERGSYRVIIYNSG